MFPDLKLVTCSLTLMKMFLWHCIYPARKQQIFVYRLFLDVEQELHDITKDSKYVCFHSMIRNLPDFSITDKFLENNQNCNNITQAINTYVFVLESLSIPLTRTIKYVTSNNFGYYKMVDFCINNNLFTLNGRDGDDR